MAAQNPPLHVIVLGAGIIGLQTAVFLLEAGYKVTVVAKNLPGDVDLEYTSPRAGAHWRTQATANEIELAQWDRETYEYWLSVVAREEASRRDGFGVGDSGLKVCVHYKPEAEGWSLTAAALPRILLLVKTHTSGFGGRGLMPKPPRDGPNPEISQGAQSIWWRNVVLNFKVLDPSVLPEGVYFGVTYSSFCINPPTYLSHLVRQIETAGGTIHRLEIPTKGGLGAAMAAVTDAVSSEPPFAIVNATGLGAMALGDKNMFPTKGQTILVSNESPVIRIRIGDGDPRVDPELSQEIVERCKELAPDILNPDGEFEIVSEQVGFRPSRSGGPRVELEGVLSARGEKPLIVVHCYGHSGAGYQSSVGSAKKVLRLLEEQKMQGTAEIRERVG
ncbi:hypothetical protein FGG08_006173 [Glutinoglossum americanum]|uniref:FAD dependent oxidoreductase domain-containing protein n=1 Tax=Glutinoglossum americanum TaxID=1670608 RepID=A0A9P8I7X8_9PEZI|nr:hypothetical protein FGG08_006173 [Glutinoglossum americanum]